MEDLKSSPQSRRKGLVVASIAQEKIIKAKQQQKSEEKKKIHGEASTPVKQACNFEFVGRKYTFAKNSLFLFDEKNKFRVLVARVVTHP